MVRDKLMEHSLQEALRYRDCLICHVLEKGEFDFMAQLQYQTLKDEKIRENLVLANGYCNFHFYQMAQLTSPLVNAVLVKDLMEAETEAVKREGWEISGKIKCPVCQYVTAQENFYLQALENLLSDKTFKEKYAASDGLCRIHLQRMLNLLKSRELSQFLLLTQVGHLNLLSSELEVFISKVRSTSKVMGTVKNSWLRAIKKRVGKKGLP